ncbi:transmembrane protein 54a [Chanos chanos]|uniref:Transmembrane protein 54a n=1 Tax=Chanos chanos TaxID=29144 RepID=A0A6J2WCL1_CHACN|nr:transmembrane protein 54-like [Chanos chanos]
MVTTGLCCANLKDDKALMKMGLGLVLVGHVNFLLGALVHGAVLRHINVHTQARAMEYAISNVIALVAGLLAVIGGISAIVLSKNKKNEPLKWVLFVVSLLSVLLGSASAIGVSISMVKAFVNEGRILLTHCKFETDIGFFSITNECPFDPTRVYGTTLILWAPLILMSVVEVVFSARCFLACISFLRLPCPWRNRRRRRKVLVNKRVRVVEPVELSPPPPEDPSEEAEPAECHELLNHGSPSKEASDWL